jgi:hypothetical protein
MVRNIESVENRICNPIKKPGSDLAARQSWDVEIIYFCASSLIQAMMLSLLDRYVLPQYGADFRQLQNRLL